MKKFYNGVVTIKYVSGEPLQHLELEELLNELDIGRAVGNIEKSVEVEIAEGYARQLCIDYGSDEEFFGPIEQP